MTIKYTDVANQYASQYLTNQSQEDVFAKIETVLQNTEFYHGTGRYAYEIINESKYEGTSNQAIDILEKILTEGINPNKDLFNDDLFLEASKNTISLSKNRTYAKLYAMLFMDQNQKLDFQFLSQKFLWFMFLFLISKKILFKTSKKILKKSYLKRLEAKNNPKSFDVNLWSSTFRNDNKYRGKSLSLLLNGNSTIHENYPVVLGVKRNQIQTLNLDNQPHFKIFESRTDRSILPENLSHIQVPFKNIDETQSLISKFDLDIPILPFEYLELYNFHLGLSQILEGDC
ncbi:hypothetical protein HOJ01_01330 [bacterium]|nr:hypothetical protein [bacterium]